MSLFPNDYRNARDVLPEELVRRLQSIHTGLVWIPAVKRRTIKSNGKEERNRKIVTLYLGGKAIREISKEFFLSNERVRQIIKINGGMKHGSKRED